MVICNEEKDVIIGDRSGELTEYEQEQLMAFSAGFGVITVGGATPAERKELADRTEDAICACRVAIKEGVLPGSGKALINAYASTMKKISASTPSMVVRSVCYSPMIQLFKNYGLSADDAFNTAASVNTKDLSGYDMKSLEEVDDLVLAGIIDPLPVTKNALMNSLSVATLIITSNCVIYEEDGN
jgi:chaperonin GroEL